MNYPRIIQQVFHEPALLTASAHQSIQASLLSHLEGGRAFDARHDGEQTKKEKGAPYSIVRGNIALVNVHGVIARRLSLVDAGCGFYDQTHIALAVKAAVDDPRVEKVIIDFDSPGGTVTGTYETGRMLRALGKQKLIYGYTEGISASASYWLMSQCASIFCAPSATLGSIGVYMAWMKDAADIEMVKAGKFKAMGIMPLTEEERQILQESVNRTHELFKTEVRDMRPDIDDSTMEGLCYEGRDCVELGLADALVLNFDEMLDLLSE